MKNRVLLLAAAGALGLPLSNVPSAPQATQVLPPSPNVQGGMQAPQGGIGSLLQHLLTGGGGSRGYRPRYSRGGHSVAQGKRAARKRRNVLRARGQYRQAVR